MTPSRSPEDGGGSKKDAFGRRSDPNEGLLRTISDTTADGILVIGEDGKVVIEHVDDGIGIPPAIDISRTSTLGMELVTTLVEQIEGSIELDRDSGTRFRIEFTA